MKLKHKILGLAYVFQYEHTQKVPSMIEMLSDAKRPLSTQTQRGAPGNQRNNTHTVTK